MEIGMVRQVDINAQVQRAYLDYAMSVIVARALPDARDGLKPVQRRILYAMYDMGLKPDLPYKKSARIVGEVLGKYHPHGDTAVYDAMARMAQDFSVRYPLVDGQGNFGSIDGDAPAAMRYTEARLMPLSLEVLADIEKDTVEWTDNFDGTLKEPLVLPSRVPNLLVNGASGIAVGMSTNIPPHNLGEVVDALIYLLDNWQKIDDVDVAELMKFIQGPDFPTGGLVYRKETADGEDLLLKAYATGRGSVTIRARAHVEEALRGRQRLIITEIPYQVNKTTLIEGIAEDVRAGHLEGIADLRDESDRQGMRIVVELTQGADPDKVLNDLYRRTPLETRYSIILLALVDGEPRRLSLKRALTLFLDHRLDVLQRRSRFDLEHARQRAHILEGLLIALDNLDAVIDTIRRSRTVETARQNLQKNFKLTEVQAQAILEMQLRRLAALERKKLQDEYHELLATIKELEALLKSPVKQRAAIRVELADVRTHYVDGRRTHVLEVKGAKMVAESLTPDQPVWVTLSRAGRLGRIPDDGKTPPRVVAHPEEAPLALLGASTRNVLYLFTATGEAIALPVHQIPEGVAWEGGGVSWSTLLRIDNGRRLAAALALPTNLPEDRTLFFATATGQVKRLAPEELPGVGRELTPVIRVDEGDTLVGVAWVVESDQVILGTALGQGIRFAVGEVRPTGARAGGMSGIRVESGDAVVGLAVVQPRAAFFTITDMGFAKRTSLSDFPVQKRSGKGVQIAKLTPGEHVATVGIMTTASRLMPVTQRGASKTVTGRAVPEQGRATRGESIIALQGKDAVANVVFQIERIETQTES
ncbi:MAG TPA: DNA gyrase subunit A [Anaerolineae bacterium]|nr:DNA gyrase subunit A [Anaerolineae bacterium]HQH39898.1 DNA gyrase subunit A [Anaerolineae bacterium]